MKILITGASGFIGSFLCEESLKRGMETWAGMRAHSSRRWLTDERLKFATLDMTDVELLKEQLSAYQQEVGRWDVIIHAGGATKCLKRKDFDFHNYICTKNFVEALQALEMMPSQFLYVSSLSVLGPIREQQNADGSYNDMLSSDTPAPNTAYGESKLAAENWLCAQTDVPWVILRPTGVYGPRERDYFLMAQSIKQHVDFAVGYQPQEITFVYMMDVVQAAFLACERSETDVLHHAYFLSDGKSYNSRAFSDLLQKEIGTRFVLHIKAPLWFLRLICAVNGTVCRWMGKLTTLNMDKYHILAQRNWNCDIEPARRELGYEPQWNLKDGVRESVKWYKQAGWL